MAEGDFDLGIVSEPYRTPDHPHWFGDTDGLAAVVWGATRDSSPIRALRRGKGYVLVEWGELMIVSCYISTNVDLGVFE